MEYSRRQGINGSYDYYATNFSIEGGRWFFEYRCATHACGRIANQQMIPEKIIFYSDDRGKIFQILPEEGSSKVKHVRH